MSEQLNSTDVFPKFTNLLISPLVNYLIYPSAYYSLQETEQGNEVKYAFPRHFHNSCKTSSLKKGTEKKYGDKTSGEVVKERTKLSIK